MVKSSLRHVENEGNKHIAAEHPDALRKIQIPGS